MNILFSFLKKAKWRTLYICFLSFALKIKISLAYICIKKIIEKYIRKSYFEQQLKGVGDYNFIC